MMSSYSSSNLDDDPNPDYTAYNPKKGVAWAPKGVHVYEDPDDNQHRPTLRRRSSVISIYGSLSSVFGSLTNLLTTPKLSRKNSISVAPEKSGENNNPTSKSVPNIKPALVHSSSYNNNHRLRSSGSMNDLTLLYNQSGNAKQSQNGQQQQQKQEQKPKLSFLRRSPSFFRRKRNSIDTTGSSSALRTSGNSSSNSGLGAAPFRFLSSSRESLHSDEAKSSVDSPDSSCCRVMELSADDPWAWDSSSAETPPPGDRSHAPEAPSFTDQEHDRTAITLQGLMKDDVSHLAIDRRYLRTGRLIVNTQEKAVCCGSLRTKSKSYSSRIRAVTIHIHKGIDQREAQIKLVRNIASIRRLRHRHVADVLGLCIEGSPHTQGGTEVLVMTERTHFHLTLRRLVSWVEENNPQLLTPQIMSTFGIQICYGLRYLEKHKIIHTNLTTASVLLDSGCICKLYDIDFQTLENRTLNTRWLPLETFLQSLFTFKSVVWTFGVVLWEMASLCSEQPYPHLTSLNDIILYLAHGKRLIRPESCPKKLYRLMCLCWDEKPRSRPSLDDLIVTLTSYRQSLPQAKTPDETFPDRDEFWEDNSWMDDLDGVYDITMM